MRICIMYYNPNNIFLIIKINDHRTPRAANTTKIQNQFLYEETKATQIERK